MSEKTPPDSNNEGNDGISRRRFLGAAAVGGIGVAAALVYQTTSDTAEEGGPPPNTSDTAGESAPPQNPSDTVRAGTSSQNTGETTVLIAYLTRTKNTKAIAEIIHQEVGGDLVEVEPSNPYPENYDATVSQVDEENESGYTPPLKNNVGNIQAYDTVFFGFPTWDMQLPPPMKSFLREYDLSDKTVVPFNTNGGYGVGSSFQTVEELSPNSDISEGYSTKGGLERDGIYLAIKGERREEARAEVVDWLQNIGV